ncbi:5'/3'-nucleotidase SurE [Thermospira aquatica]|uniref:5'-nucleotidase SurE n=1 Tax=Thermospira aquatica TaxID=2828656 RepID=A0AAX3BEA5_9SPIR|nr:5'/3'-nucleotidase SurE [Thermospira aquatica]URA10081.1 5'/3'-nucleotidase SurE [Thermospira aquatica]
MRLLLTNDDGYSAEGIQVLSRVLGEEHEVYITAPLSQQSGTSHAMSLFRPMEFRQVGERAYALAGTPADCVKVALLHFFQDVKFDMVVSGINHGPNMGEDIFYSGTVAGAREGTLNGLPSVALSLNEWEHPLYFEQAARFFLGILRCFDEDVLQPGLLLNINFPHQTVYRGIKITHLGKRVYRDTVSVFSQDGKNCVTIEGEWPKFVPEEGTDMSVVEAGFVSLTPLAIERQDKRFLVHIEKILKKYEKRTCFSL